MRNPKNMSVYEQCFWVALISVLCAWVFGGCASVPSEMHERTPEEANQIISYDEEGGEIVRFVQPPELDPEMPLIRCTNNVLYQQAWILYTHATVSGNFYVYLDTNGDGQRDVEMFYLYGHDPDNVNPDGYKVDRDHDGEPDTTYKDEGATGDCDNIKMTDVHEAPPVEEKEA